MKTKDQWGHREVLTLNEGTYRRFLLAFVGYLHGTCVMRQLFEISTEIIRIDEGKLRNQREQGIDLLPSFIRLGDSLVFESLKGRKVLPHVCKDFHHFRDLELTKRIFKIY